MAEKLFLVIPSIIIAIMITGLLYWTPAIWIAATLFFGYLGFLLAIEQMYKSATGEHCKPDMLVKIMRELFQKQRPH